MQPVQILMALALAALVAPANADAQVSRQTMNLDVFGQYQTNEFIFAPGAYTNESRQIQTVYISTAGIVKALAIDYGQGTNWLSLNNTLLVRETDFTGGLGAGEGIFLYRDFPPTNVNVSTNFRFSYISNFTQDVSAVFPGVTNLDASNTVTGGIFPGGSTNTNSLVSAGLFAVSFYTTNVQFNLICYGTTTETTLVGFNRGVPYSGPVQSLQLLTGVGTFGLNVSTNYFEVNADNNLVGPPNTNFASGPAHVFLFSTEAPIFMTNTVAF